MGPAKSGPGILYCADHLQDVMLISAPWGPRNSKTKTKNRTPQQWPPFSASGMNTIAWHLTSTQPAKLFHLKWVMNMCSWLNHHNHLLTLWLCASEIQKDSRFIWSRPLPTTLSWAEVHKKLFRALDPTQKNQYDLHSSPINLVHCFWIWNWWIAEDINFCQPFTYRPPAPVIHGKPARVA